MIYDQASFRLFILAVAVGRVDLWRSHEPLPYLGELASPTPTNGVLDKKVVPKAVSAALWMVKRVLKPGEHCFKHKTKRAICGSYCQPIGYM